MEIVWQWNEIFACIGLPSPTHATGTGQISSFLPSNTMLNCLHHVHAQYRATCTTSKRFCHIFSYRVFTCIPQIFFTCTCSSDHRNTWNSQGRYFLARWQTPICLGLNPNLAWTGTEFWPGALLLDKQRPVPYWKSLYLARWLIIGWVNHWIKTTRTSGEDWAVSWHGLPCVKRRETQISSHDK
jgi:hypothetical protein